VAMRRESNHLRISLATGLHSLFLAEVEAEAEAITWKVAVTTGLSTSSATVTDRLSVAKPKTPYARGPANSVTATLEPMPMSAPPEQDGQNSLFCQTNTVFWQA